MHRRLLARASIALLLAAGVFTISARCIENDTLRRGTDGNWHIYGEIHNETDVQGLNMVLNGATFDANGRQLSVGQALMCPASLSPDTFSVYDVAVPSAANPASHKVNVVSGGATSNALTPLQGSFQGATTEAFYSQTFSVHRIFFSATFVLADSERVGIAPGGIAPSFTYCVAFYGADGRVVDLLPPTTVGTLGDVNLTTKGNAPIVTPSDYRTITRDAVTMRFILWRGSSVDETFSAPAISAPIIISWQ